MRNAILKAHGVRQATALQAKTAHPGLFMERYAPLQYEGRDAFRIERDHRDIFLDKVVGIRTPAMYATAFRRWEAALADGRTVHVRVQTEGRLLIGHGNPSGIEVGLSLHHTYGVPFIPGTALKGLLNHYMADWGAAADEHWLGVTYDEKGNPHKAPGAHHGTIFGAPNLSANGGIGEEIGARGGVVFQDAWYVPGSIPDERVLAPDVLTPHQKTYYDAMAKGKDAEPGPTDWDDPNPVAFLTVRPGAAFVLAVTSLSLGIDAAELALRHLVDALESWGVGAKTSAGYGRLVKSKGHEIMVPGREGAPATAVPTAAIAVVSEAVVALREAVQRVVEPERPAEEPPVAQRFDRELGTNDLLDALGEADGDAARAAMEPVFKHAGLSKRRGARIDELRARFAK